MPDANEPLTPWITPEEMIQVGDAYTVDGEVEIVTWEAPCQD